MARVKNQHWRRITFGTERSSADPLGAVLFASAKQPRHRR
jgi:hypothetical protein